MTTWEELLRERLKSLGLGSANFNLYGAKWDGSIAFYRVSYNSSTRPSFETAIFGAHGKVTRIYGHPRRNGVTKAQGWSIDPQELRADWS
jgi:hypothetical protein